MFGVSAEGSLRRRLLLKLVLPLLALFALGGALAAWAARHYANHVYDRWLYDSAQSLAQQVRLTRGMAALHLPPVAQEMFEWDAEDRILFRVEGSSSGLIAGHDVPMHGDNADQRFNLRYFDSPVDGRLMRWAVVTSPLPPVGEEVTIVVGETTHKRDRLTEEIMLAVWLPQVLLLVFAGGFAWRTIVEQTQKLHALSVSLRDMSFQTLAAVPADGMPEEMRPLLEALNALIVKLDAAALAHRSFVANAAHQLRTPLTSLSLQVEEAAAAQSLPEMRSAVADVRAAVQRATRLANQLLLLSRAEPEAQSGANRARTDLYDLAFETARLWVPAAIAAGIDLGFDEKSAHATVDVDAALLAEAINNLLDNALKYCARGSRVTVSVQRLPEPSIVVEDSGRGIPADQRSLVVRRFHRGDHGGNAGTGLGLAIANEIALSHAGTFVIADAEGGGARFEIRLPAP